MEVNYPRKGKHHMNKVMVQSIAGLLAIFLCGCSTVSQVSVGPIAPGDHVDDFVFSTADEKIAGFPHNYTCTENGNDLTCKTTAGTRVNISPSFYDDTFKGRIEELWSGMTYEMVIGGRPVNLQAFGYIDVPNPAVGSVRKWNVAMVTEKPGEIVVHHSVVFDGKPDDFSVTWTFTEP
jgi:hypothetical protein